MPQKHPDNSYVQTMQFAAINTNPHLEHITAENHIEAPTKQEYPTLAGLCINDEDSRAVFEINADGSKDSFQKSETAIIQHRLNAPFIGKSNIITLLTLYDKHINLQPIKRITMHTLGKLLNLIATPAVLPAEDYNQLMQLKNDFIASCCKTDMTDKETKKKELNLSKKQLPPSIQQLIENQQLYQQLANQLKQARTNYRASLQQHRNFIDALSNQTIQELVEEFYILAQLFHNHPNSQLPEFSLLQLSTFCRSYNPLEQTRIKANDTTFFTAEINKINFAFSQQITPEIKCLSKNFLHTQYIEIIKTFATLIPFSSYSDKEILINLQIYNPVKRPTIKSLKNSFTQELANYQNNAIKKIEAAMLETLINHCLTTHQIKAKMQPCVKQFLTQKFNHAKQKLGYTQNMLIKWKPQEENPFLLALQGTEEKIATKSMLVNEEIIEIDSIANSDDNIKEPSSHRTRSFSLSLFSQKNPPAYSTKRKTKSFTKTTPSANRPPSLLMPNLFKNKKSSRRSEYNNYTKEHANENVKIPMTPRY